MNPTFADFTDSLRSDFHHITNKRDGIPLAPLRRFGCQYPLTSGRWQLKTDSLDAQPDGELHISKDEVWFSCPGMLILEIGMDPNLHEGHDNPSKDCSAGAVPHLWDE